MKKVEAIKLAKKGLVELHQALQQGHSETLLCYLDPSSSDYITSATAKMLTQFLDIIQKTASQIIHLIDGPPSNGSEKHLAASFSVRSTNSTQ